MERRPRPTSLRDRARYLFDRTLARSTATLLGWLGLSVLVVVVPVSALVVWTDPAAPPTLSGRLTAVWRTSAETLRLGGVTGAPLRMLLSVVLGLIALLCVSTVVGVITTGLGDRLAELRRGRSTVLEHGHAVVVGWSDQIATVVGELVAARAGRGRGVVAVLADRDKTEMEQALTTALRDTGDTRLVCRSGPPSDPAALALVAPGAAASVLVLPAGEQEADDLTVVRTLLALRALRGGKAGPPVVAAVRDDRYLPAARSAAGPHGTVLETDLTTARLLVQSARRPGLSAALRDLLDFAGAEFHVLALPGQATGTTFRRLALRFEAVHAVGLLRADGTLLLTPDPHLRVEPGDRLVAVAHDDSPAPPVDCRVHVDPTALAARTPAPEGPSRTLLLGWNRRAPLVVGLLRRTARPGSVLDVVAPPGSAHAPGTPHTLGPLLVTRHTADPAGPELPPAVDPFAYDSVLVLGPDPGPGAGRPDDTALLTLLTLRTLEEERGRALPVVAELRDHRSRPVAPAGPATDIVVRGELTALLMAQISQNPALAAVFEEVFATRGGALALRPATDYVVPGREVAFATVVAAALDRGECALGYRPRAPLAARPHDGVRLCPPKPERRVWSPRDDILVMTPARTAPLGEPPAPAGTRPARPGVPGMRRADLGTGFRRSTPTE